VDPLFKTRSQLGGYCGRYYGRLREFVQTPEPLKQLTSSNVGF